jgi:ABC-type Fe3+ transport system permease subunit
MDKQQEQMRKRSSKVTFVAIVVSTILFSSFFKLDTSEPRDIMIAVGVGILICTLALFLFRPYIRDGRKSGERNKPSRAWLTKKTKRRLTRLRYIVFAVFVVDILVMVYILKAGILKPYQSIGLYIFYVLLAMAFTLTVLLVFGNEKDPEKQDESR